VNPVALGERVGVIGVNIRLLPVAVVVVAHHPELL